jgi:hypothetical protein
VAGKAVKVVTRSRTGVMIRVDVNQNRQVDAADTVFDLQQEIRKKSVTAPCVQHMINANAMTTCNYFPSGSTVEGHKENGVNVVTWLIPISELTTSAGSVSFQLSTWDSATRERKEYPGPPFSSVYRMDLSGSAGRK